MDLPHKPAQGSPKQIGLKKQMSLHSFKQKQIRSEKALDQGKPLRIPARNIPAEKPDERVVTFASQQASMQKIRRQNSTSGAPVNVSNLKQPGIFNERRGSL
mmetsp:Transcript_13907/g.21674  ORF Transcript_13907/g.21674 Transcript_13907/m.21674 type:complete len:102 (+) Transcript_13907:821-1126(+)|eukprot:CAMPEP_0170504836 /NCGR_PEP_ID=MMETSP0208-20121228/49046_1 /TAXON_ID=197538 /ORGANISM="Strombidium inclinatum, Strain S3" /LENGTH=101 /DNA_ID=CAMNT_0010785307 /DNA_START=813 /DNA_END=1118 /DNA_ORIENTATION=-